MGTNKQITMNTQTETFEVLRKDGVKQYYNKQSDSNEYFPLGGGFAVSSFDAISVTKVNQIPTNYVKGIAHFDCDEEQYKAIEDSNKNWNGWSMPYIHINDVKRLCELLSLGYDDFGELYTYNEVSKEVVFTSKESEDYTQFIKASVFDGEIYYNFGWFGLTFEFKI